jgi:hypothetical protein
MSTALGLRRNQSGEEKHSDRQNFSFHEQRSAGSLALHLKT